MNPIIYKEAVEALAIPKLTAFLKLVTDTVEIEGWSKLRAPEKRANMLEALEQSSELRKEFVVFYGEEKGTDTDYSEWETSDLPEVSETPQEPAPEPPTGTDVSKATAYTPTQDTPTAFVEGAFEVIVSEVAGLDAVQSKANLHEAEDRMQFEHIRIGALLAHIQKADLYIQLGYDNLREFLHAETTMDYRKGVQLIKNFNTVKELGIPAKDLTGVTWAALRHIVPILTATNYKKWLDAARSSTHITLIEQVYKEKTKQAGALPAPGDTATGEAIPEQEKLTSKVFNVYAEQNANITAAIDKAKNAANVNSMGAALDIIASAYIGSPASDATIGAIMPDTSVEGLTNVFSKMANDDPANAIMVVFSALEAVWPTVEVAVTFPPNYNGTT